VTASPSPTALPIAGWPECGFKLSHQRPFGPGPLQTLQPYYERFCPRAPHRYSGSCGFRHLSFSLRIGTTGSPVPHRSLIRVLAAFMPGASGALSRPIDGRPHLVPGTALLPGFDTVAVISTRHQRFTCVQLHGSHLTQSLPRLFHRRSPPGHYLPSSSWRFEGCSCAPPPGGPPPSSTKHPTLLYSPFSSSVSSGHTVLPNSALNRSANGRPPGPSRRYAVHCRRPGPGVLPSSPG
jgi:hypothetical protein